MISERGNVALSHNKFDSIMLEAIERGEEVRPRSTPEPEIISADFLRKILIGAPVGDRLKRAIGRKCELTAAGVVIDGGHVADMDADDPHPARHIVIRPDHDSTIIDLSNLARADGNALPPLILRNCIIEGILRISGSHFAAFGLQNCALRKLDADACQIDGDCRLVKLQPLEPGMAGDIGCCQVRLVAARIDGTLDLRGSTLKAPAIPPKERLRGGRTFADRFALSLASSEIAGRLLLTDGFIACGGVSLFQAQILYSVRIADASIEALYPLDRAIDASEINVQGSFFWLGKKDTATTAAGHDIAGSAVFIRAQIGGDLYIENCRWRMDAQGSDPVGGGVDMRFSRTSGQLRFSRGCRVARQAEVPTGLKPHTSATPSLDCWKATFGLGIHLHPGTDFAGPVLLNACHVQRDIVIAADIGRNCVINDVRPFVQVLDLSDTKLDGLLLVETGRIVGRASFQRLKVDGSVQIRRLGLICASETKHSRYQDTSILDFQDMSVQGIIDLSAESISVASDPPNPSAAFIVDMRGMSCDSLDDADGRCWAGLSADSSHPWRLRYDGITFNRIEKSTGRSPLIAGKQITKVRVQALQSFFRNRPSKPARLALRIWQWLTLLVVQPKGNERELRQFSPQAYETFARGYGGRGDLEVAVGLILARSDVLWLLRVRGFTTRWLPLGLLLLAAADLAALRIPRLNDNIQALPVWPALLVVAILAGPPAIAAMTAVAFRMLFGYGLQPRRAIFTFCLCCSLLLAATYRGMTISPAAPDTTSATPQQPDDGPVERALFAFDVIVPIDLGWKAKYATPDQGWPRIVLGLFEILGWIVTSMTIVTISGVLKRDIER
jgi:hypothetical protein